MIERKHDLTWQHQTRGEVMESETNRNNDYICPECGSRQAGGICYVCDRPLSLSYQRYPMLKYIGVGLCQIPLAFNVLIVQEAGIVLFVLFTIGWSGWFVNGYFANDWDFGVKIVFGILAGFGMTIVSAAVVFGACGVIFAGLSG